MEQAITTTGSRDLETHAKEDLEDFVTFTIKGQMFGIPVLNVQDILTPEYIASIPLAPVWREFALGVFRLEEQLMVVLDVARLLNLKDEKGK